MDPSASDSDNFVAAVLGERYRGRRYLRYADLEGRPLALVKNRSTLNNWIAAGRFPPGERLPSRYGSTLVWSALAIAIHVARRDGTIPEIAKAAVLVRGPRLFCSTGPLPTGQSFIEETDGYSQIEASGASGR
jgi:hypothetical protein